MKCINKHPMGSKTEEHCYACKSEMMDCCQCGKPTTNEYVSSQAIEYTQGLIRKDLLL